MGGCGTKRNGDHHGDAHPVGRVTRNDDDRLQLQLFRHSQNASLVTSVDCSHNGYRYYTSWKNHVDESRAEATEGGTQNDTTALTGWVRAVG